MQLGIQEERRLQRGAPGASCTEEPGAQSAEGEPGPARGPQTRGRAPRPPEDVRVAATRSLRHAGTPGGLCTAHGASSAGTQAPERARRPSALRPSACMVQPPGPPHGAVQGRQEGTGCPRAWTPQPPASAPLAWVWPPPKGCGPLMAGPQLAPGPPQGARLGGHQGLSSPVLCAWGQAELQEGVRPAHNPQAAGGLSRQGSRALRPPSTGPSRRHRPPEVSDTGNGSNKLFEQKELIKSYENNC